MLLALVLSALILSDAAWAADPVTPCNQALPGAPGIAGGSAVEYASGSALTSELNGLQSLGAGWLRLDVTWSDIQQGGPTSYDWSVGEQAIRGALSRGISVDGNIAYTPAWARPPGTKDDKFPPRDPATYARFAAAAARHYAPMGVHTWEIWNEPNNPGFWKPQPNAAQYAALLQQAYAAIKAVDPTATVIVGGLSNKVAGGIDPVAYLSDLYAHGAAGSFDAVADHPYTYPDVPPDGRAWQQMSVTDPSLRSLMVAHGDAGKKIWVTEYGAPTAAPDGVDETQQAKMITQAFQSLWSSPWAGPLFVYSYKDLGTDGSNSDNFFGLLRHDGSKKPSWAAFQQAAATFDASCPRAPAVSHTDPTPPLIPPLPGRASAAAHQGTVASSPPRRPDHNTTSSLLALAAVVSSAFALARSARDGHLTGVWNGTAGARGLGPGRPPPSGPSAT